jgi:hypothetical protein
VLWLPLGQDHALSANPNIYFRHTLDDNLGIFTLE